MSPNLYDVKTIERKIYCILSIDCKKCNVTLKYGYYVVHPQYVLPQ